MDIKDEFMRRVEAELSKVGSDQDAAISVVVQQFIAEGRGKELEAINWDLEAGLASSEAEYQERHARFLRAVERRVPEGKTVRDVWTEQELEDLRARIVGRGEIPREPLE